MRRAVQLAECGKSSNWPMAKFDAVRSELFGAFAPPSPVFGLSGDFAKPAYQAVDELGELLDIFDGVSGRLGFKAAVEDSQPLPFPGFPESQILPETGPAFGSGHWQHCEDGAHIVGPLGIDRQGLARSSTKR